MGTILVSNLGKAYKHYRNRWSRLVEWFLPGDRSALYTRKWVLQDVNFEIQAGEAVGIIGVNGAGKSTLLKMITGTVQPTTGIIQVSGRIAALLELGMGFHPDFTGRQNAIMAGQLQGLTVDEIQALMPEIERFAEIGEYIDQPVRVYSSGMQVRLAFSVATASRPDILIVDEALAVGDVAFQRKCYQRIEGFRDEGTTLLFVSHDIETVKRLCDKAVFIHQGRLVAFNSAKSVCDAYEQELFGRPNESSARSDLAPKAVLDNSLSASLIERQYGDGGAEIFDLSLQDEFGNVVNLVPTGSPFSVNYCVKFKRAARRVEFGMMIKSVDGACIYGTNTANNYLKKDFSGGDVIHVRFLLQGNLVSGSYYLNVGTTHGEGDSPEFLHRRIDAHIFKVVNVGCGVSIGFANMFAVPQLSDAAQP